MLHYISKERFEKNCLGKEPQIVFKNCSRSFFSKWYYYEVPEKGGFVFYIMELRVFLVFNSDSIIEDDLIPTFDDWSLDKISEKPDPRYILNHMRMLCNLSYDFGKICDTGIWKLTNSRTGDQIEFSIKLVDDFGTVGIGYQEKLELPLDKSKLLVKDTFIETLCNGLRLDVIENNI